MTTTQPKSSPRPWRPRPPQPTRPGCPPRRAVTVRWREEQDGRDAGRVEVSTPPTDGGGACLSALVLSAALLYLAVHMAVWGLREVLG